MLEDIIVEVLTEALPSHRVDKYAYGHPVANKWAIYVDGICHVAIPDRDGSCLLYNHGINKPARISAADPKFFDTLISKIKYSVELFDDTYEKRWGHSPRRSRNG